MQKAGPYTQMSKMKGMEEREDGVQEKIFKAMKRRHRRSGRKKLETAND